ncbi:hypothetical protein J3A83DRAFT_4187467 [Scleroderma citrinum]
MGTGLGLGMEKINLTWAQSHPKGIVWPDGSAWLGVHRDGPVKTVGDASTTHFWDVWMVLPFVSQDQNQSNQHNVHYTVLGVKVNQEGDSMAQCYQQSHKGALAKEGWDSQK